MKYSNITGVIAAFALMAVCFVPWVYIDSINETITGFETGRTNFGRPGAVHVVLLLIAVVLFLLPKVWAKRTNLFVVTLNFAWAIRNFLLITQCELGECPQKKAGIYGLMVLSFIVLIMAMTPKLELNKQM